MKALTDYFKTLLSRWGVEASEVNWRLSHCQGDGVAFRAKSNPDEAIKLLPAVFHSESPLERVRARFDQIPMARNIIQAFDIHYTFTHDSQFAFHSAIQSEMEWAESHLQAYPEDQHEIIEQNISDVQDAVLNHIRSLALRLERIGYKILDSFCISEETVWCFHTERFRYELRAMSSDPSEEFCFYEDDDFDYIVNNDVEVVTYRLAVTFIPTECELASEQQTTIVDKNGAFCRSTLRYLLSEAMVDVRKMFPKRVALKAA